MATENNIAVSTGRRRRSRSVSPSDSLSRRRYRSRSPLRDSEVCGNSKCRGNHTLRSCNGPPSPAGDILGCPLCNTEEHDFDHCDKARQLTITDLWRWLCVYRETKPPIRSSISVLMIAAYMKKCDYMPMTKSFSLKNWKAPQRDGGLPKDPADFISKVCENWTTLTDELCYTIGCPVGPGHAANVMPGNSKGVSGFTAIPLNLLLRARGRPATNRGRDWTDRHREFFAAWGYGRIYELPMDEHGNDYEPEDYDEEEMSER